MPVAGSVLPYFGAKRTLAPQIVERFPGHTTFLSPFCGSLAEIFAKPRARLEIASDLNPFVVNLLRVLGNPDASFAVWSFTEMLVVSEDLFAESARMISTLLVSQEFLSGVSDNTLIRETSIKAAIDYLVCSWQGPSGLAGTTAPPRFARRRSASGGTTVTRWINAVASIPAWHDRLREVEFRRCDWRQAIDSVVDEAGTLIYCDPPYLPETRSDGQYLYDFAPISHFDLAERLNAISRASVFVSYRRHPSLAALYPYDKWQHVPLIANASLRSTSADGSPVEDAAEVLIVRRRDVDF